ncbi:uncharacterized protein LACBIDRAFT_312168 [Laccaria bicolor S238N-H82]|uniref:Predicted protein n=1 Tax=Laccaria bicolor (strain S238N-H82 / ATCC MYA-4686) TaxID=486041 RepID=B0DVN2_LACBS|nr:uncharacterized protein LACBIDRAFT_312168 [Laccaria bicolor S238N-H82]EDR01330.1 predicted protein [Laccaria bicolor S238N-H82]|eukprot:XP_001888037.1 predicted protein [Laccaria bicolor S238N-H82]
MPPPWRWHARILLRASVDGLAAAPSPSSTSASRVSFSSPVRQTLFEFEDCPGGKLKAECAAVRTILYPGINLTHHSLHPCRRTPSLFTPPPSQKFRLATPH